MPRGQERKKVMESYNSFGYIQIDPKVFKETLEAAGENSDTKGEYVWDTTESGHAARIVSEEIDSGNIHVAFEYFVNGEKLGYFSTDIKISDELAQEIIEIYTKKLNKMKAVLEAMN